MKRASRSGFTLTELLVTLAVASVLLGVGVPSFVEMAKDSRTRSEYNRIALSLSLARSEAAKRSRPVTLCARRGETQCGTDWSEGWLVFVDLPPVVGGAIASLGPEDTVIGIENGLANEASELRAFGSTDGRVGAADVLHRLTYRGSGGIEPMNASFVLCDDRGAEHSRVANIVLTGDVRPGRPDGGERVPRDVFGRPIDCSGA